MVTPSTAHLPKKVTIIYMDHSRQNYTDGSFTAHRFFFIFTMAYVSYRVSWMHTKKYTQYLKSHWSQSERHQRDVHPPHLWGVWEKSWEKEPETGLLCTSTLLRSLRCKLNCALGWGKAMYFSMGKENGWALCLCKVRVSPQVASSTPRAKMRAVLRTRM